MSDYEEKFSSLSRVYGEDALARIRQAHVCVVGIGGVGSWAAEALARTGIGQMTLVDGDTIHNSNTNRQVHTLGSTLGLSKVDTMKARILDINPECTCHIVESYIDDDNARDVLERGYDCVIDAIDSIRFKALMIYCCKRNKIPIVTTGGAGGLTDPTQVQIADLTRTWNDPLAAKVRSRLRFKYNFTRNVRRSFGIPCVFSTEQQRYPDKEGKVGFSKPGIANLTLDCNYGYGSTVVVTAGFGFAAASKAIQIIMKNRPID